MKVSVAGKTARDLQAEYGLCKATAHRAVARGYFCPQYHVKNMVVGDMATFPVQNAVAVATAVFCRHFRSFVFWQWKDDLIQEALLRMLELSGISSEGNYLYKIAHNAMRDFARKNRLIESRELHEVAA